MDIFKLKAGFSIEGVDIIDDIFTLTVEEFGQLKEEYDFYKKFIFESLNKHLMINFQGEALFDIFFKKFRFESNCAILEAEFCIKIPKCKYQIVDAFSFFGSILLSASQAKYKDKKVNIFCDAEITSGNICF